MLDGERDEKVSGQWISWALFLLSHSFVLLRDLHLLDHLVFEIVLIIVFMGRSICVWSHFVEILFDRVSRLLIMILSLGDSRGWIDANRSALLLPGLLEWP